MSADVDAPGARRPDGGAGTTAAGALPPAPEGAPPGVLTVDLDWRSVAWTLVLLAALAAVVAGVRTASGTLTVLVVAVFVALALDPVVTALQRRGLSRGWATVATLSGLLLLVVGFGLLAGPQLAEQSRRLGVDLPRTARSMEDLPVVGPALARADVAGKVSEFLSSLPRKLAADGADLGGLVRGVGVGLGVVVVHLLVTAGVLFEGPGLVRLVRAGLPASRRRGADALGRIVYRVLARYFAGSLLIAVINGVWVAGWALVAGVPLSPVLGVWAAVTSLIPQIGGLLGFALVLAVSLAAGLVPALVMTLAFAVLLVATNHLLLPTIVGRAVRLSAPATMVAAIAGLAVAGVVGALVAVPGTGVVKALVLHLQGRDPADGGDGSPGLVERWRAHRSRVGGVPAAAPGE